jgi:hypothetical protein
MTCGSVYVMQAPPPGGLSVVAQLHTGSLQVRFAGHLATFGRFQNTVKDAVAQVNAPSLAHCTNRWYAIMTAMLVFCTG